MGKLIVIEGLDGSGKTTQVNKLFEYFNAAKKNVRLVKFPDYESNSSALVKMYLNGEFGQNPNDINAYAASMFYAVDRYAAYKKNWAEFYTGGGIILCDRYTSSNAIHQCAKLPENKWKDYTSWLYETEFVKMQIPKPDLTIFLDVEPNVSQRLMSERYKGDESKKDIHERDLEYQKLCRSAALWCCKELNWECVTVSSNGNLRKIEAIAQDIMTIVRRNV